MYEESRWNFESTYFFLKMPFRGKFDIKEVETWCLEQFGPQRYGAWESCSDMEIRIDQPADAFAFKMRWC